MLGGNGTPDNYNAQRASSLLHEKIVEENADVRTGRTGDVRLEKKLQDITL